MKVLGDETLRAIARELVRTVRNNVTIDWTLRENVARSCGCSSSASAQARLPPDKQEKAAQTVLEQAECLAVGLCDA